MANKVIIDKRGVEYGNKSDCTVRTLSISAGISYEEAFDIAARLGRKDNHGFSFHTIATKHGLPNVKYVLNKVSPKYTWIESTEIWSQLYGQYMWKGAHWRRSGYSVTKFIKDHPTGTFVVRVHGHVFTVINGVIYDGFTSEKTRKQVVQFYEVTTIKEECVA